MFKLISDFYIYFPSTRFLNIRSLSISRNAISKFFHIAVISPALWYTCFKNSRSILSNLLHFLSVCFFHDFFAISFLTFARRFISFVGFTAGKTTLSTSTSDSFNSNPDLVVRPRFRFLLCSF
jgi:hypothetical protein